MSSKSHVHATGCESGKVEYERKVDATQAAVRIRGRGSSQQEPYQCPHCSQWHLRSAVGHLRSPNGKKLRR